jgi:histidine triad (HIT) family protein
MDIHPAAEGHTLVIPKEHTERIDEAEPKTLAEIATILPWLTAAVKNAVGADGYNVLCNNGAAAGQVVKHLHVHIIPRKNGDGVVQPWKPLSYPEGKIQKIADKIIANLTV